MTALDRWLDELALRTTRTGFLRAAVAAVGGLALPLGRASLASAAPNDPTACRKGCFWTAHRKTRRTLDACDAAGVNLNVTGLGVAAWVNPLYGLAIQGTSFIRWASCKERALLVQKAAQWDCMQPNCPGFDPAAAGGPCDGCTGAGGICCPDSAVVSGYSCCTGQGGCCDPSGDGCASGTTACGG